MEFTPYTAKIVAENIANSHPIFAKFGERKGLPPEKAFRFEFLGGEEIRHICISSKGTGNGVTAYINKYSTSGIEFPEPISDVTVKKFYPKGYEGKNGKKGISSAAAQLNSLNPKENDVLRLSISNEIAFKNLFKWYLDENKNHFFSGCNQSRIGERKLINDESHVDLGVHKKLHVENLELSINFIENLSNLIDDEYGNKPGGDIDAIIKRRIGQSNFRSLLGEISGMACNVSGLNKLNLLIASHIVPWSRSTGIEKTDPDNGLLLAINWDAVFDKGLICFDDQGKVIFSNDLNEDEIMLLGLTKEARLQKTSMTPKRLGYLARHRVETFESWKK